jgi:hypothetical protein
MANKTVISKINKNGVLLVFPIKNSPEPNSVWAEIYPRKKMRWEWNDSGDDSVFKMWSTMKELSQGGEVVYSKWYQGRATFFSRELFQAILCVYHHNGKFNEPLSHEARNIFSELEMDSPLSTKQLKKRTELQGRFNESSYSRAMKLLFFRFLIVAYGEVDDGAFPSLAVGATQLLYEELWNQAQNDDVKDAQAVIDRLMPKETKFRSFFDKNLKV